MRGAGLWHFRLIPRRPRQRLLVEEWKGCKGSLALRGQSVGLRAELQASAPLFLPVSLVNTSLLRAPPSLPPSPFLLC